VQKGPCGLDFAIFKPVSSESLLPAWSTFGQQFTENNPPFPWVSRLVRLRKYGNNRLNFLYLWLSPHILKFPQVRPENPRVGGSIPSPATNIQVLLDALKP
jgi:hypothetical protein